jgi:hypothetical protein
MSTTQEPLPPLYKDQRAEDRRHLKYLSTGHFVFAGFLAVGIGFLALHYWFMHLVLGPGFIPPPPRGAGAAPLAVADLFSLFRWFYLLAGGGLLAGIAANVLSGRFLTKRRHRLFSLVVGVVDLFQFPFGTALGVFALIVLVRGSVVELYDHEEEPAADPAQEP